MVSKYFASEYTINYGTIIWTYYTFVLQFHELIKDKNKIRWNQTEKLIIDPNLDFNKRANVQFLLTKNLARHFQNLWSQSPQKQKPCSIPISKVICVKPPWSEKTVPFKNKSSHNLETLKWIHAKCVALSQTLLLLNYGKFSSLSPKHWGSLYPKVTTWIV